MSAYQWLLTGLLILALPVSVASASLARQGDEIADGAVYSPPHHGDAVLEEAAIAVQVVAGDQHTCAVIDALHGGGVECWGWNWDGQLGDGTQYGFRTTPVDVSGLRNGMQSIAASWDHTCVVEDAVQGDGAKCWGRGYGTTPADISALGSGVQAIAAGGMMGRNSLWSHNCALTVDGGIKCWGDNDCGQLGDGTTTGRVAPVDVIGLSSGIQAITTGAWHTCALTADGGVKCWGYNGYGQLGDGTYELRTIPVDVSGLSHGVRAIDAGDHHTCALKEDGGVKCWGGNGKGQLGDGTQTNRNTPVDVSELSGAQAITSGGRHTCALAEGGRTMCWGFNRYGQLGDGTTAMRLTPVVVSGLGSQMRSLTAGGSHTCVLADNGWIKCWGENESGQLGDGTLTNRSTPVDVVGLRGVIRRYLPLILYQ